MSARVMKLYGSKRPTFDYGAVDRPTADFAQEAVGRIRQRERDAAIEIGRDLIAVKEKLGHGRFGDWLECEFGWTSRTAQSLMQVASEFGDKYEMISHLPRVLQYALCAPSTPESVRDAVRRHDSTRPINPNELKRKIAEAKTVQRKINVTSKADSPKEITLRIPNAPGLEGMARSQAGALEERRKKARDAAKRLRTLLGNHVSVVKKILRDIGPSDLPLLLEELTSDHVGP